MSKKKRGSLSKQPVQIVDVNGHLTTRHKNVEQPASVSVYRLNRLNKKASNPYRDEEMLRRSSLRDFDGTPLPRTPSKQNVESLTSDGKNAARAAIGYLRAADKLPLTAKSWDSIVANLNLYAHNASSSNNVWQPVSSADRGVFQRARDAEMRALTARGVYGHVKNRISEIVYQGVEIGNGMRDLDRERYKNLTDEQRSIYDGLALLGLRRGYRAIPDSLTSSAIKRAGFVGNITRSVVGFLNNRSKTLNVLQRAAVGDGQYKEQAAKLLNLLGHSNKPTKQLIDEIVAKKGTDIAENDLRSMLSRRTHIELTRFRSELD